MKTDSYFVSAIFSLGAIFFAHSSIAENIEATAHIPVACDGQMAQRSTLVGYATLPNAIRFLLKLGPHNLSNLTVQSASIDDAIPVGASKVDSTSLVIVTDQLTLATGLEDDGIGFRLTINPKEFCAHSRQLVINYNLNTPEIIKLVPDGVTISARLAPSAPGDTNRELQIDDKRTLFKLIDILYSSRFRIYLSDSFEWYNMHLEYTTRVKSWSDREASTCYNRGCSEITELAMTKALSILFSSVNPELIVSSNEDKVVSNWPMPVGFEVVPATNGEVVVRFYYDASTYIEFDEDIRVVTVVINGNKMDLSGE